MARLKWSPQAQGDIVEIYETIWLENMSAAERMFDKLEAAVTSLVNHPRLGVRREYLQAGTRQITVRPYVIYYATLPDTNDGEVNEVEILRVLHGHQLAEDHLRR